MNGILISGRSMARWLGSASAAAGPVRGTNSTSGLTSAGEFGGTMSRRAAEPPSRRAAEPPSRRAAEPPSRRAAEPPSRRAASSASAWHSGLREPATGRRSNTRRRASFFRSHTLASARRFRRGLLSALLGLPLLFGFAASAQAQSTPGLEFSTTHLTWNESQGLRRVRILRSRRQQDYRQHPPTAPTERPGCQPARGVQPVFIPGGEHGASRQRPRADLSGQADGSTEGPGESHRP